VNIVDYIDEDDIMTPFGAWSGNAEYVFGTELPKVVLNEVYAEVRNAMGEDNPKDGATKYQVNLWLELLNPLPSAAPQTDPNITAAVGAPADRAAALLAATDTASGQQYAVHRVLVAK